MTFLSQLSRRVRSTRKKLQRQQSKLEAALHWEEDQQTADLLQAHFHLLKRGLPEITLTDWTTNAPRTIPLDPALQPKEQIAALYKAARKKKRSIPHLQQEITGLQASLQHWEELHARCEKATTEEEIEDLRRESGIAPPPPPGKKPPQPQSFRRFTTASGLQILVGRTAAENDHLTIHIAKGSDYWLHASHDAGAHVVLQVPKGQAPDPESLQDALQIALHYSKARKKGEAEVCITQRKYVHKPKGSKPGLVHVSKHRNTLIRHDPQRLEKALSQFKKSSNH